MHPAPSRPPSRPPARTPAAATPRTPAAEPDFVPYRPFGWRRRLATAGLAVVTAVAIVWMLLDPPGGVQRKRAAAPAASAPVPTPGLCTDGQTERCVGGKAEVIVAPRPPAGR
jgi:hypothetical protein